MRRGEAPTRRLTQMSLNSIAAGVALCFVITLSSSAVLAIALVTTPLTEKTLPVIANLVGALSVFAGGFVSGRRSGGLGWLHGALAGTAYTMACYILGSVAFPGLMPAVAFVRKIGLGFGIGLVGGIAGVNY